MKIYYFYESCKITKVNSYLKLWQSFLEVDEIDILIGMYYIGKQTQK